MLLSYLMGVLVGAVFGWVRAKAFIADSCRLQGSFTAFGKVYWCTRGTPMTQAPPKAPPKM